MNNTAHPAERLQLFKIEIKAETIFDDAQEFYAWDGEKLIYIRVVISAPTKRPPTKRPPQKKLKEPVGMPTKRPPKKSAKTLATLLLAERIRNAVTDCPFPQKDFARMGGYSVRALHRLMKGEFDVITDKMRTAFKRWGITLTTEENNG